MKHRGIPQRTALDLSSTHYFFGGCDPATKRDWATGLVAALPRERPRRGIWMPRLAAMERVRAAPSRDGSARAGPLDVIEALHERLFSRFPLERIGVDATHDPGLENQFRRWYGESRTVEVLFGRRTNLGLWTSTLYFVNPGWPWARTTPGTRTHLFQSELIEQMTVEQVIPTEDGSYKFRHPGPHNDWLHGFNVLCHVIYNWQVEAARTAMRVGAARGRPRYIQRPERRPRGMASLDSKFGRKWRPYR